MTAKIENFMRACRTANIEKLQTILEKGFDIESLDKDQLTGLIWAGRKGKIETAKFLLSHGADLEHADSRNRTSLFHAVTFDRQDYVKYLASKGANVNVIDTHGWSPLDFAQASQFEDMQVLLKELGGISKENQHTENSEINRLTFRTVFGGPSMPNAYRIELDKIKAAVKGVEFQFDLDLRLTIGSDMVRVTHPTGLRSPRVKLATKTVTGTIFINEADTKATKNHAKFFKRVIAEALEDIFKRIKKKAPDFDIEAERAKVAFLLDCLK